MTPGITHRTPTSTLALALACLLGPTNWSHLYAQYDPEAAEPIIPPRGTLFLGGGGELPDDIYRSFVRSAGRKSARLVVLTTAARRTAALTAWQQHEVASLSVIAIDWRQALTTLTRSQLNGASGIWIDAGNGSDNDNGDAKAFANATRGQPIGKALQALLARRGTIGCNGAITRAMGVKMIRSGDPHALVGKGLGLVPGAVIDDRFSSQRRRNRLLGVLAASPTLVGFGIDKQTAIVLHRRFIDVLGQGSAYACIIGSERRLLRIDPINRRVSPISQRRARSPREPGRTGEGGQRRRSGRQVPNGRSRNHRRGGWRTRIFRPRRLGDLLALSRSAHARVAAHFPAYNPKTPNVKSGALVIVGGGGIPRGLVKRFIELAGGPEAPLVYIPCDEREEIPGEPRFLQVWRRAGAKNVDWLHTKDRRRANGDAKLLAKLRRAKGIWFGGGRQWNLVDSYQHTTAHKLMHDVLARGGVIGGSSAGASIQGSYMVRGNSLGNLDPMAEGYEIGLGFLTGVAIDQHFTQRRRLGDMTKLVATYPELLGIGIDESAAIIVQGSIATAFSRAGRNVLFYDRRQPVVTGQRDHIRVANGQRFDLASRQRLEPASPSSGAQHADKIKEKRLR